MRACGSGLGWPDFGSGAEEGGFWATTGRTSASDAASEAHNKRIRVKVIILLETILYGARAHVKRWSQRNWMPGARELLLHRRRRELRPASLWHGRFHGSLIDELVRLL